jgi:hypothetical protein
MPERFSKRELRGAQRRISASEEALNATFAEIQDDEGKGT